MTVSGGFDQAMELVVGLPIKFCEQQCDLLHGEVDRKVAESRGVCHVVDGAVD